ncbi:type IV pilus modification PilV family protein [Spiribacter insolitus]|uniref:Type IV fimbrial biogenesis protein PilV n=1 Tax=Spiribacter insolitus TaxID=3122417 RepID=A0ABV3T7A8_9GAMM
MRHEHVPLFRDAEAGSSLVEVLVAALVLSIGLLGLSMSQAQSLDSLRQGRIALQARLLAVDLAEQWRAARPHHPPAASVADWRERVQIRLPAGRARIEWPSAGATAGRVSMTWSDRSSDRGGRLELEFGP